MTIIQIPLEGGDKIQIENYNLSNGQLNIRRPKLVTASGNTGYASDLNLTLSGEDSATIESIVESIASSQTSVDIMIPPDSANEV